MPRTNTIPQIMIVEDDVLVARDIQESVERLGYGVAAVVHSGEMAVATAVQNNSIDLALMDIRLPGGMDGTEAAEIIGEIDRIPVVYLTAYTDDYTLARAGRTNHAGYVIKPFNERDLKSAIELALHRAGMEAELEAVRQRYRRIFESGVVGHVVLTPDGWMIDSNPAFLQLCGFNSIEEAKKVELFGLLRDPADENRLVSIIRERGRLQRQEIELTRKDGTPVTVLADAIGCFDAKGRLIEIHGHCIDITEERRLQSQLAQADKREALARMAGATCHQFNNVLSVAQLQVERILSLPEIPQEVREAAWDILHAVKRGEGLTRELLRTAGTDIGERKWVDVSEVVRAVRAQLPQITPSKVLVRTDLRLGALVLADPERLERALLDLVENGIEAMQGEGTMTLRTYRTEILEAVPAEGASIRPGSYAVIEVEDTGEGILPGYREKVFDPYFTNRTGHLGMGLPRALGILRWHEGGMELLSTPGVGTRVRMYLPLHGMAAVEVAASANPDASPFAGTETILVVDDSRPVRDITSRLLRRFGYNVLLAEHGREALDILAEEGSGVQLIVTDVVMPHIDGIELILRLRAGGSTIPVLVLSSQVGTGSPVMGRLPPDVALVSKPFAPGELMGEIRRLLDPVRGN